MVPPPGQEQADPISKDSALRADGSGTSGGVSTEKKKAPKEEQIVFLCPNGHKLNGPARMQGKAGQCPECGARFRIPSYDEGEDEGDPGDDDEILTGEVVGDDEVFDANELEEIENIERSPFEEFISGSAARSASVNGNAQTVDDAELVTDFVPTLPEVPEGAHALAGIFALLWRQREHGGVIEMQLKEGELLTPDFYSPDLSLSTHGVFAVKGKDGSFTITSVPWDAVIRVSLRKTQELPPSLFEE